MNNEPDITRNRHRGNPESVAAHQKMKDGKRQQRQRVLEAVRGAPSGLGLCCHELAAAWGTTPNAISGRFTELKKAGKIRKVGTRQTPSGSPAAVYQSCDGAA